MTPGTAWYAPDMALQERDFFTEKSETRPASYACPRCGRRNEYQVRWVRRVKKDRIPAGANERDRALYAKLRDYIIRIDDVLVCKTCQRKFEIPSHQSLVFIDDIPTGLPKDVEEDEA
jgi:DNA-directed RNA polymerase subunit RPC12/RpoP